MIKKWRSDRPSIFILSGAGYLLKAVFRPIGEQVATPKTIALVYRQATCERCRKESLMQLINVSGILIRAGRTKLI